MLVARMSLTISERDSTLVGVHFLSSMSLDLLGKHKFQNLEIFATILFPISIAISLTIVGRGRLQRTPKFTLRNCGV